MEIQLNRKALLAVSIGAGLMAASALWVVRAGGLPAGRVFDGGDETTAPGLAFVRAFYEVDYQQPQAWLARLQPLMTSDGYAFLSQSLRPVLWPELESAQIVTLSKQIRVEPTGAVLEGQSPVGGAYRVQAYRVRLAPSGLWPTMTDGSFTAQVLLAQESGTWKAVMFLDEAQVDLLRGSAAGR